MNRDSIRSTCKTILALVIVFSSLVPMALGQPLLYTVSGSNFQVYSSWSVTRIEVLHSYSAQSGSVWLIDQNGNQYGPWNADTSGSTWKVYWNDMPLYLYAGNYRLVDSDPGTYLGQAWIFGEIPEKAPPKNTSIKARPIRWLEYFITSGSGL